MKKIDVSSMLEKKYKTRMLVYVASHVSYQDARDLLQFLKHIFPRHCYHFFSYYRLSDQPIKYGLYYSLNCRELEEVISRYKKENEK